MHAQIHSDPSPHRTVRVIWFPGVFHWEESQQRTEHNERKIETKIGCVLMGCGSGSVTLDYSDHGASKEPRTPFPEWIQRFL